jgi:hypothetical protein
MKIKQSDRIKKGSVPFECPVEGCGKVYVVKHRLAVHIRSHVRFYFYPIYSLNFDLIDVSFPTVEHNFMKREIY